MTNRQTMLYTGLLTLIPCLLLSSSLNKSVISDEPNHLYRGYRYLVTGHLDGLGDDWGVRVNEQLSGLFVRLFHKPQYFPPLQAGESLNSVSASFAMNNGPPRWMMFWARLPFVGISVLLGILLFRFVRRLYGVRSGLLALFLYTFSPNLLAHARFCVADFTGAAALFAATVFFLDYLEHRGWGRLIACGLAGAVALMSKESMILLVGLFPAMMALNGVLRVVERRRAARSEAKPAQPSHSWGPFRGMAACLGIALVGFVAIWGAYRFEVNTFLKPGKDHDTLKRMNAFAPLKAILAQDKVELLYEDANHFLETTRVPAASFLRVMKRKLLHAGSWGQSAFLHGSYGTGGWVSYFPVAFLVKVPLAITILFAIGLLGIFLRPTPRFRQELLFLIPPAGLFAAAMFSSLNIGFRHVLGVLPFVMIIGSRILADRPDGVRRIPGPAALVLVGVLCVWLLVASMGIHPHYLAYFNEIAGGPEGGIAWLADSNLDWGQDLPALADWLEEHDIRAVHMSYSGAVDPQSYGIKLIGERQFTGPDDDPKAHRFALKVHKQPKSGYVAVSVTNLQGVYFSRKDAFDWLKDLEPVAKIGYSIYVYHLPEPVELQE